MHQVITWRSAVVTSLGRSWHGAQELYAEVDGQSVQCLAYPELVGSPVPGDRVLLNTTAQRRGLGTGGYAFVVALPDRLPSDPPPAPGHIVKSRYSPMQTMVLGADEQESVHHGVLAEADALDGMPVVVADLHSALPAIIAGARHGAAQAERRLPRVAYVMTDGAALPVWFSRTVAGLREAGWIEAAITVGQAFGGDYEAVTVHSGLLVARHVLAADVAVVTQGPGNVGTGTRFGFSGVAVGEALNAAVSLSGEAVAALRVSGADERRRHVGISHHSLTALRRVVLRPVHVPVPDLRTQAAEADLSAVADRIKEQIPLLTEAGHHVHPIGTEGLMQALARAPVSLSTMGRGLQDDPASFLAGAGAGLFVSTLMGGDQRG